MTTRRAAYRDFPGRRWLIVALRALHLVGMVGLGADIMGGHIQSWSPFVALLVASGLAMIALDAWSNPEYLRQYCGAGMLLKLALLLWLAADSSLRLAAFWVVLGLSAFIAHAPGRWRHRRLFAPARGE